MSKASNSDPNVHRLGYAPTDQVLATVVPTFLGWTAVVLGVSKTTDLAFWSEMSIRPGASQFGKADQIRQTWETLHYGLLIVSVTALAIGGAMILRNFAAGFRVVVVACKAIIIVEIIESVATFAVSTAVLNHWAEFSFWFGPQFGLYGIWMGLLGNLAVHTCVPASLIAIVELSRSNHRSSFAVRKLAFVVLMYAVMLGIGGTEGNIERFTALASRRGAILGSPRATIGWADDLTRLLVLGFCTLADLFFSIGGALSLTFSPPGRRLIVIGAWILIVAAPADDVKYVVWTIANYFGAGPIRFGNVANYFMTLKWLVSFAASALWLLAFPSIALFTVSVLDRSASVDCETSNRVRAFSPT